MPSVMKPRAPLYGCSPLGVGTPLVESLTGFVGRLAVARHLPSSAVFDGLIRPLMIPGTSLPDGRYLRRFLEAGVITYDGLGVPAEQLVSVLERLTARPNLAVHTLLPWRGLLPRIRGSTLGRGPKRWCASCFIGWRKRGLPIYEPLLWRLGPVRRCSVHRTLLSKACPHCGATQGIVQEIAPFGACWRCRKFLAADDVSLRVASVDADPGARWEWWTAVAAGRMLASMSPLCSPPADLAGFVDLLKHAVAGTGGGSVYPLAKYLGVSSSSVTQWITGCRSPRLDYYLAVCMRLRTDPVVVAGVMPSSRRMTASLLWAGATPPWPRLRPFRPHRLSRRSRDDPARWAHIESCLTVLLRQTDLGRLSLTAVASSLHVSSAALKSRFPVEAGILLDCHAAYRARTREHLWSLRTTALRRVVHDCIREGRYPAKKLVFERAGLPATFRNVPLFKRIWLDSMREHGVDSVLFDTRLGS